MTIRTPAAPAVIPHGQPAAPLIVHVEPLPVLFALGHTTLLDAQPTYQTEPCRLENHGRCCCTCAHHADDLAFDKGIFWICLAPLTDGTPAAYSQWAEHGLCEDYEEARP